MGLLEEGGLEARTAGKRMLWALRRLLDGAGGDEFKRALARLDCKTDKVRACCWMCAVHRLGHAFGWVQQLQR